MGVGGGWGGRGRGDGIWEGDGVMGWWGGVGGKLERLGDI